MWVRGDVYVRVYVLMHGPAHHLSQLGDPGTPCTGLPRPLPGAISVQDSSSLDFESSPRLRLVVQAETAASFGFMAVNLNLQDVNDNLPRFQLQNYVAFIWESQSYDSPVIQVPLGVGEPQDGAMGASHMMSPRGLWTGRGGHWAG